MGTIDRLRQIKLTKKNCQKLLELNEGFVANTNYNSKKGACKREYSVSKGKLYIQETIKKSANNYELSWIATDEEVHRFLLKYLEFLLQKGLSQSL